LAVRSAILATAWLLVNFDKRKRVRNIICLFYNWLPEMKTVQKYGNFRAIFIFLVILSFDLLAPLKQVVFLISMFKGTK